MLTIASRLLRGIRAVLRDREVFVSLQVIARTLQETAGHMEWLVPMELVERKRVARLWLAIEDELVRDLRISKRMAPMPRTQALAKLLKAHREQVLPALFAPSEVTKDRSGRIVVCGERIPTPSKFGELAGALVPDGRWPNPAGMYDLLSNATHPSTRRIAGLIDKSGWAA
jgi:hypothetical protein